MNRQPELGGGGSRTRGGEKSSDRLVSGWRVACLRVPSFPVQALRRSCPELAETPLAVAAGPTPRDEIVAVSAEAVALGARVGWTAAQVRQRAPGVKVAVTPPEVAAAAAEALADVAEGFSPRLRRVAPGEVWLDVAGVVPLWGSEPRLAGEVLRRCRRVGLEGCVGVASSGEVARVAARLAEGVSEGVVVVPPGQEREFLAPLPLPVLDPPPAVLATLARWGLATAGEVAALAREEVALRLGREGVRLHRLAAGEEDGAFVPDLRPEELREGVPLEFPLTSLEPFLFVLHGVLSRLAQRLEVRGEGFADVFLELGLEGGGTYELPLRLVAVTREVAAVQAMVRLQLEAHPPGAPVEEVAVRVVPGRLRLVQGSLFGPPQPAPGKLAQALARLAALAGTGRVGAPAVRDSHRPDPAAVVPFAPRPVAGDEAAQQPRGGPVLRRFRPPRPVQVVTVGSRPVVARLGRWGGVVARCAGPYRFVGEWWSEEPFARDEYDVATADGTVWRLAFDRLEGRWWADGVYD